LEHERVDNENKNAEIEVAKIEEGEEGGEHDERPKSSHFPVALGLAGGDCNEKRADFLFHFDWGWCCPLVR
jgi:hypothetical protein